MPIQLIKLSIIITSDINARIIIHISLLPLLTDNMSDVVIVCQSSNLKDTNLPSDTISMTTSLEI